MARGSAMPTRHCKYPDFMECTPSAKLVRRPRNERRASREPLRNVGDSHPPTPAPESASALVTSIERGAQHLCTSSSKRCSLRDQENRPVRRPAFLGGRVLSRAANRCTDAGLG